MVRNMAKSVTPGYVVVYPNRDKASSKATKLVVVLLLLVLVALMLLITIGGWSKLQGLKALEIIWCLIYLVLAFYVGVRWSRGALTMAAALAVLLLIIALIAADDSLFCAHLNNFSRSAESCVCAISPNNDRATCLADSVTSAL